MTCTESRRLMHLDRPGERSEREMRAWLEHLKGCPTCAAEAETASAFNGLEQRLRETATPLPDLSVLRVRIMAATGGSRGQRSSGFSRPRLAYAITLAAALIWFGADQWWIRTAHADLHQRTGSPAPAAFGPQIVYTIDAAAARHLTAQGAAIPPGLTTNGAVEVAQSTALQWLESMPSHLIRTMSRTPAQRAQLTESLRILRSAVDVTIRYRSQGA